MSNETKPDVRVTTKESELLQQLREEAEVVELQVYLNQYRQALYQLNQFIQQNTLGTLMLSEAVGLDKNAPYGGLDLYLIPKDPSLYAKPSLVSSTNLFNIWQRLEQARAPEWSADRPLPRFDWSKLEYPRFGPFKFYIGSHLGWSKDEHD